MNRVDGLTHDAGPHVVNCFMPELSGDNCIFVSPSIGNEELCDVSEIWDYLDRHLDHSRRNHVIFTSSSEGMFALLINRINDHVLGKLINERNVAVTDIYFISGAMPTENNTRIFYDLIRYPIRLIYNSSWAECAQLEHQDILEWCTKSRARSPLPEKKFLCMNNASKPHRLSLAAMLVDRDLDQQGFLSSHFQPTDLSESFQQMMNTCFPDIAPRVIHTLNSTDRLPAKLDHDTEPLRNGGVNIFRLNTQHYNTTRFSVVTETQYLGPQWRQMHQSLGTFWPEPSYSCAFASEKTYKPIIARHPFVMVSTAGFLKEFRSLGFQTFSPWINEDYDLMEDDQQRLIRIVDEIHRLCNLSDSQWTQMLLDLEAILEHNVQHLLENHNYVVKTWLLNNLGKPKMFNISNRQ